MTHVFVVVDELVGDMCFDFVLGELVGDPYDHHTAHTRGQEDGSLLHSASGCNLLESGQLQRSHRDPRWTQVSH